jgi:hypothetical protein
MQRPSYEPFDPQQSSHTPLSYGNPTGGGGSGYAHPQYNQQNFVQQSAPPGFVSRYEVDQSGEQLPCHALNFLHFQL